MKYVTTATVVAALIGVVAGYVFAPVITKVTDAKIPQVTPKAG